jgi:Domain of unknown function (DUF4166)
MNRRFRAFDATMINSATRGSIVDYLGTRQHIAVDIRCSVGEGGAMCIESGAQRLYEGWISVPVPLVVSGVAKVREWWDEDEQRFKIEVRVENRLFGLLFGYRGSFTVVQRPCPPEEIPFDVKPLHEEARE